MKPRRTTRPGDGKRPTNGQILKTDISSWPRLNLKGIYTNNNMAFKLYKQIIITFIFLAIRYTCKLQVYICVTSP